MCDAIQANFTCLNMMVHHVWLFICKSFCYFIIAYSSLEYCNHFCCFSQAQYATIWCKQWKIAYSSHCFQIDHTESADVTRFSVFLTSHLCFAWKHSVGLSPILRELTYRSYSQYYSLQSLGKQRSTFCCCHCFSMV